MKLITPIGLLISTALLAIYAVAAARVALIEDSYALGIAALVAAIASVGTAYMQRWSRHLVYLLSVGFALKWCVSVFDAYRAGFFEFQFGSVARSLLALAPELALLALSACCSWMVHRHYARTAGRRDRPQAIHRTEHPSED